MTAWPMKYTSSSPTAAPAIQGLKRRLLRPSLFLGRAHEARLRARRAPLPRLRQPPPRHRAHHSTQRHPAHPRSCVPVRCSHLDSARGRIHLLWMTDTNGPAAPRTAPLDIEDLLRRLEKSGQSTAAFARDHGVPAWKLYNALRARAKRSQALIPVVVSPARSAGSASLELALASGHRLVIPADFDEQALRRLMGILAGC